VYVIVWEFQVPAEQREAFERAYGPDGEWARLFGRSAEFRGTELLRATLDDLEDEEEAAAVTARDGTGYLTVDRWSSRAGYVAFNEQFAAAYEELDTRLAALCDVEVCLGKFDVV
jgi:hypothetical protein